MAQATRRDPRDRREMVLAGKEKYGEVNRMAKQRRFLGALALGLTACLACTASEGGSGQSNG
ncbi:MAG TPA: hypothetical protein VMU50_04460, partial [Polyangia bacterium]|nr:hypothetical protein [Polyangia bacterium]